jgi:cytochrome c oxidase subunit I+III
MLIWTWRCDPASTATLYDIGDGIRLPDHMSGRRSHAWWAVVVLLLVDGMIFASLCFSYGYLWRAAPQGWPPPGQAWPAGIAGAAAAAAWMLSAAAMWGANRALRRDARPAFTLALVAGVCAMGAALAITFEALASAGVRPQAHAWGAVIYALLAWQALHVVLLVIMTAYTLARSWTRRLDHVRRSAFDHERLLWHYTVAQGFVALALMHGPGLAG